MYTYSLFCQIGEFREFPRGFNFQYTESMLFKAITTIANRKVTTKLVENFEGLQQQLQAISIHTDTHTMQSHYKNTIKDQIYVFAIVL